MVTRHVEGGGGAVDPQNRDSQGYQEWDMSVVFALGSHVTIWGERVVSVSGESVVLGGGADCGERMTADSASPATGEEELGQRYREHTQGDEGEHRRRFVNDFNHAHFFGAGREPVAGNLPLWTRVVSKIEATTS